MDRRATRGQLVRLCLVGLSLWSLVRGQDTITADTPTKEFTDDWSRITFNTSTARLFTVSTPDGYGNYDDVDDDEKPRVLIAQGKYIIFSFPHHKDCTAFRFVEKQGDEDDVKLCTGSEKLSWWWIYDWKGGRQNNLHMSDIGDNVLFETVFNSLPDYSPNLAYVDVKSGAGWMYIFARITPEDQPNLVGFEVLYKTQWDSFWWRSYVETVDYTGDVPFIRPSHYCPEFRGDGTLCLLVSDGVVPMADGFKFTRYQMRFASFRVQPFNRSFGTAIFTEYESKYCDWLKEDCFPPMGAGSLGGLNYDSVPEADAPTTATDDDDNASTTAYPPPFEIATTWAPEWWLENASVPQPPLYYTNDDLWLVFLALLIILICCIIPFAIWAGTRAGYDEAGRNWAELMSSAGNVNIPLGYVATEWQDANLPPD